MDACASLWIDGELVHLEELVLHDAGQDIQAPSHALTIARDVLRLRRRIEAEKPHRCLEPDGIRSLRTGRDERIKLETKSALPSERSAIGEEDPLSQEIARIDALLARSDAILKGQITAEATATRTALLYDDEWDEDERLASWCRLIEITAGHPPALQAVILLDAWQQMAVFQHQNWLGRFLAMSVLRTNDFIAMLPAINLGLRLIAREKRGHKSVQIRLCAGLEALAEFAELGLKEHDRLLLARQMLERRLLGKRSSSKLSEAIECVISHPVVSTHMIAQAAQVTPRAALRLIEELNLREVTGRGRFRAWGIL